MNKPVIGCALWSLGATPDIKTLRMHMKTVADIGCKAVQLWAINVEFTPCICAPDVGTKDDRRAARDIAQELGLTISAFCAQMKGSTTYGGFDEKEGLQDRIDLTRRILDNAAEMNVPIVTTHPGIIPEQENDPRYDIMLNALRPICDHAGSLDISFAIETGQETPEVQLKFIEAVDNPGLKVNYDPCNLLWVGPQKGTINGVHVLREYIVHTHAKDNAPASENFTCGEGTLPWGGYLSALKSIDYSGVMAIENEAPMPFEQKVASIERSYAFLSTILKKYRL